PRLWAPGPNGHTLAIIDGTRTFAMGATADELRLFNDEYPYERPQHRRIALPIAVSTKEVTYGQFREFTLKAFNRDHDMDRRFYAPAHPARRDDPEFGPRRRTLPVNKVSWYDAAQYCNWLSQEAGIPREEWCYREPIGPGMILEPEAIRRKGFRL